MKSIHELRLRGQQFVLGKISFAELRPALGWYSFDDEDEEGMWDPQAAVKDLAKELQKEYLFYVKWRGLAAKGYPPAKTWVYGDSQEPYGWIDKEAFHKMFSEEFSLLKFLDLPGDS